MQCLLNKLKKDSLLPGVVFSFSKKKCEECADFLRGEDLNSAKEKSQVRGHRSGHKRLGHTKKDRLEKKDRSTRLSAPLDRRVCPWIRLSASVLCVAQVHLFSSSAIKRLQDKDQQLPQVQRVLEMAKYAAPLDYFTHFSSFTWPSSLCKYDQQKTHRLPM